MTRDEAFDDARQKAQRTGKPHVLVEYGSGWVPVMFESMADVVLPRCVDCGEMADGGNGGR